MSLGSTVLSGRGRRGGGCVTAKKNWTQEGRKGKDFWPQGEKEIFLKKKKIKTVFTDHGFFFRWTNFIYV